MATSNGLVDKTKMTEKDVIKDWLENIFKVYFELRRSELYNCLF